MSLSILNPALLEALPEAVCLDLDNTVYAYEPANGAGLEAVFQKMTRSLGLPEKDIRLAFDEARRQVKGILGPQASSHSRLLYFQRMLEIIGLKTQPLMALDMEQTFWRHYLHSCRLHEGVQDFLFLMRSKNIATVVITDLNAQIQFRKIIYLKIDGLLDFVVSSEEAGFDKPHEAPFKLALEKLGMAAEKVWMIGDSYEKDIGGAQRLGFRGIFKGRGSPGAWAEFDSFPELIRLVQRIDSL